MLSMLRGKLFVERVDREMKKQRQSCLRSTYVPKQIVTVGGIDVVMSIDARGVRTLHTAFDANDRLEHLLAEDTVIDITFRDVT